jgi:hypothetical protein
VRYCSGSCRAGWPGGSADDRLFASDLDGSRRYGEQCLAGTRALGERWYESQILRTLALTSMLQGRYQQAVSELRECLEVALELGDMAGVAIDLDRLGQVAVALGYPNEQSWSPARHPAFVSPSAVGSRSGLRPVGDRASPRHSPMAAHRHRD